MPTTDCGFSGPQSLTMYGPTLIVEIGFDADFETGASSQPALLSGPLLALVDTGATESCIDAHLADELSLPIFDRDEIVGAGGISEVNVYLAQIYIPSLYYTIYGQFSGVNLTAGEQLHHALIGRTFLRHFNMAYEERTGSVIISND